jgi:hypothetical protein
MGGPLLKLLISSRSIYKYGYHRQFLFLIGRFLVSLAKRYQWRKKNHPIRYKNRLWRPCLLTDWDGMSNSHRGTSIDASYQVSVHLAKLFQRRRFLEIDQLETRIACGRHLWNVLYGNYSSRSDLLTDMATTGESSF